MRFSEKELTILIKLTRQEIRAIKALPHLDEDYLKEVEVLYEYLKDSLGEDPFE